MVSTYPSDDRDRHGNDRSLSLPASPTLIRTLSSLARPEDAGLDRREFLAAIDSRIRAEMGLVGPGAYVNGEWVEDAAWRAKQDPANMTARESVAALEELAIVAQEIHDGAVRDLATPGDFVGDQRERAKVDMELARRWLYALAFAIGYIGGARG